MGVEENPNPARTTGEHPIVLPTPVAVYHEVESKFSVLAKFFAWLTGLTLSISVLVALVSVTSDRNNLQAQLQCRAAASVSVNRAIINEQVALADHNVLVGKFITILIRVPGDDPTRVAQLDELANDILRVDADLVRIGNELREAIGQQQASLTAC